MNRNDFINMIENRAPVNRQMVGEVYELINIFPYFQSAHMLLLRGLHNNSDVKFENQLKQSAIHIADREVLYYLLKNEEPCQEVFSEEIKKDHIVPEERVVETHQTVIESAKNSEDLIIEIEKNTFEEASGDLQHTDNQSSAHSVLISTEINNDDPSGVMFLIEEENSSLEDKVFYMDPGFSAPDYSDLLELDLEESNDMMRDDRSTSNEVDSFSRKQLQSDLIEKFIISNPRIEPVRDKSDLPVDDLSKPYTEEKGGFLTETLARIYVKQGYYSKAIDIYEKLSLKFPEKSSYFATQIEKVKEFIKK